MSSTIIVCMEGSEIYYAATAFPVPSRHGQASNGWMIAPATRSRRSFPFQLWTDLHWNVQSGLWSVYSGFSPCKHRRMRWWRNRINREL